MPMCKCVCVCVNVCVKATVKNPSCNNSGCSEFGRSEPVLNMLSIFHLCQFLNPLLLEFSPSSQHYFNMLK